MQRLFFKRKKYGWGWTPATWEGWLIIAVYVGLVLASFFAINRNAQTVHDTLRTFIPEFIFYTIFLIFICVQTGESPHWQWGEHAKDRNKKNVS